MRFDPTKALEAFRELSDPRFAGPDVESRAADFVADRFATMGLTVDRRQVVGSAFPQRIAPWVGWLGYGLMVTAAYGLIRMESVGAAALAFAIGFLIGPLVYRILRGGVRLGRRRPPLEDVPLVVASMPVSPPPPVRVVFQAVLGGLRPDAIHAILGSRFHDLYWISAPPLICGFLNLITRLGMWLRPERAYHRDAHHLVVTYLAPVMLVLGWAVVLMVLSQEYQQWRRRGRQHPIERRGLAVLLELARSWPRTGSRPIEPVFVAAGGQRLDHAGSRELVRLLQTEWADRPWLLILLFAPGAGDVLWLSNCLDPEWPAHLPWLQTRDGEAQPFGELAKVAAESLWIPFRMVHENLARSFWPIEQGTSAIVLMGSDPRAYADDSVDPQALHRAAQLAHEIALRWARSHRSAPVPTLDPCVDETTA